MGTCVCPKPRVCPSGLRLGLTTCSAWRTTKLLSHLLLYPHQLLTTLCHLLHVMQHPARWFCVVAGCLCAPVLTARTPLPSPVWPWPRGVGTSLCAGSKCGLCSILLLIFSSRVMGGIYGKWSQGPFWVLDTLCGIWSPALCWGILELLRLPAGPGFGCVLGGR